MSTCCTLVSALRSKNLWGTWCRGSTGIALLLCLLVLPHGAHGQSSPSALKATDLLDLQTVHEVVLSPSGRNVAYTVRRTDSTREGSLEDRTQLYVASSSGRDAPRLLTRGPHGGTHPAWHPEKDQIAFVRPVDGTPQIFILSMSGGEPYQLTDFPHGATQPNWSPTGDRILFSSTLSPSALRRWSIHTSSAPRPGRTPQDTVRRVPPDTVLILRHHRTLDPVDTLALGTGGRLAPAPDRTLQSPAPRSVPDNLRALPIDSLRTLSSDSLRTLFDRLRMLPDTTTVPVSPDTAAHPDGDLLQRRRWLDQQPTATAQTFVRSPLPRNPAQPTRPLYQHYFVTDVPETIEATTLPPPRPRLVTRGPRSFRGGTWLPGGRQVVVSAPPADPDSATFEGRALYLVDVTSFRPQRLLQIDGYTLSNPAVTADGTTLAFRVQPLSDPSYQHNELGIFDLDGRSNPELITKGFDYNVETAQWSPDGWYLYVTAPVQGGRRLYRVAPFAQDDTSAADRGRTSLQEDYTTSRDTFDLDSTMVRTARHDQALPPARSVQDVDVTDSKVVYATSTPTNPSEVYSNTVSFNKENRLSAHNTDWTQRRYFPRAEWVRVWNDGLRISGRLTLPSQHQDSSRTPLAVLVRGGPPALDGASPRASWTERQYLAERGYGVLEVWPRGSEGFGNAFRRSNFQDWGPGPASDVLALTDSVLARHWADPPPQVLAGRAYGGTLAAWMAAHTDRFEAVAAQSGVYDLRAFFDEGSSGPLIAHQFGGAPWDSTSPARSPVVRPRPVLSVGLLPRPAPTTMSPRTALRRSSPLADAAAIETPLLLLHGTDDEVVSPTQAERLYRRLTARNHPVEYVRYPNMGHAVPTASPSQRMDRLVRLHEFFARYVSRP